MTKALEERIKEKNFIIFFFFLITLLTFIDHYIEVNLGSSMSEILQDFLLELPRLLLLCLSLIFLWRQLSKESKKNALFKRSLLKSKKQSLEWKQQALSFNQEVKNRILKQFQDWKLSKSEVEVALLILKGLSTKEISQCRFTSERTTRNQCRSIYDKSELAGRHELSGYFLEQFID